MSKTNDTKKIRELTEDHRPLADSELDAVTGGFFADYVKQLLANSEPKANGSGSWFEALATALGQAMNSRL
jgi:hypothetical protein